MTYRKRKCKSVYRKENNKYRSEKEYIKKIHDDCLWGKSVIE